MTKYAISKEGAEALENLSNKLEQNVNIVSVLSTALGLKVRKINGPNNSLGIYYEEIESLVAQNLKVIQNNNDNLVRIRKKIHKQAEMIVELVHDWEGEYVIGRNNRQSNWKQTAYYLIYDSPNETNKFLLQSQGNAYPDYQDTCGLCACANILRLAGLDISEKEVIDYASKTKMIIYIKTWFGTFKWKSFICGKHGATGGESIRKILEHYGIDSEFVNIDSEEDNCLQQIAHYVEDGKGVILPVNSNTLWYGKPNDDNPDHVVVVTSMMKTYEGAILGFYICDTGRGEGTRFCSADEIRASLTKHPMNVTTKPIREGNR